MHRYVLIVGLCDPAKAWGYGLLAAISALLVWRTKVHLRWLIAAGAMLGALDGSNPGTEHST